MKVLSIFSDEAGQQDMSESYYLLTVVTHEQDDPIDAIVADYERRLSAHGLPNTPFHMKDLLHGHFDYEGVAQACGYRLVLESDTDRIVIDPE